MSLSAYNAARVDAPCVEPVKLLTIAFDGLTVYLGDRVFGCGADFCKFDGRVYEPLVLSWEAIEHGRIDPVDYSLEPSSAGFTLDNSVPVGGAANITALFSVYDPHYATVTISRIYLFNGQVPGAGDRVDLFAGKIEDLPGMSREQVGVTCTGLELDIANRFPVAICTTDEYPGADPDDVGKMLPVVYGRPKRVPALAVDAGSKSRSPSPPGPAMFSPWRTPERAALTPPLQRPTMPAPPVPRCRASMSMSWPGIRSTPSMRFMSTASGRPAISPPTPVGPATKRPATRAGR
jgi:hypothetical protein